MGVLGSLGSLNVLLSADTAQFSSAMDKAAYVAERNLQKISSKTKINTAVIITALVAVGTAFAVSVKKVIDQADEIEKASQSLGMTTEELSKLKYAAELSGVSFDNLKSAVVKMGKSTSDNASIFKALGIEVKNSNGSFRNGYDILLDFSDVISGMPNGIDKTNTIIKVFGKNAANLAPLFNKGSKGIRELSAEAESLGIVLDQNTAAASERFNDNMERMAAHSQGLVTSFTSGFIPTIANLTDNINSSSEALEGFKEAGRSVSTVIVAIVNTGMVLIDTLKTIIETAGAASSQIVLMLSGNFKGAMEVGKIYIDDTAKRWSKLADNLGKNWDAISDKVKSGSESSKSSVSGITSSIEEYSKKIDDGKTLTESLRTAQEKYNDEISKYNDLLSSGAINQETYSRAVEKAKENLDKATEATNYMKDAAKDLGFTFQSAFEDAIIEGKSLSEVLSSLLKDIERIILRTAVTGPLAKALSTGISSFFGNAGSADTSGLFDDMDWLYSAHGNAFSGGRLMAYANGGLITRPTVFPMANGGVGLAGEAGTEAIMPLFRTGSGDLGVKSSRGGGGGGVEINVYAPAGSSVSQNSQTIGDKEQINIMIDKAVAGAVKSSGSKTHKALKNSFGLKQSLTTR